MALVVQKFGGSSVADIARIQNVARIVADTRKQGNEVLVVVSAMYGETDRLINLAKSFSTDNSREYDMLLSTGEQVSAALLSMALERLDCPASSYTGAQVKILTTNEFKKARIIDVECDALKRDLHEGRIPVVAGFQGISDEGNITTLGRGGSDLTAVALAAVLKADECQIFTDVDGVYTSDPKVVPDAKCLKRITFDEMMEYASMGAKVLQNRCLEFAGKYKVPIRVLSSLKAGKGTLIDYNRVNPEKPLISGVAFDRDQAKITLQRIPDRPGLASYILSPISQHNIEIDMMAHGSPSEEGFVNFSFTLHREDYQKVYALMREVANELSANISAQETVAKLSLVGVGIRSHADVASKMFSVLGKEGIDIYLMTCSEIKISVIIDEKFLDLGARVLHTAFFQLN